jgi:hypothetical protein
MQASVLLGRFIPVNPQHPFFYFVALTNRTAFWHNMFYRDGRVYSAPIRPGSLQEFRWQIQYSRFTRNLLLSLLSRIVPVIRFAAAFPVSRPLQFGTYYANPLSRLAVQNLYLKSWCGAVSDS